MKPFSGLRLAPCSNHRLHSLTSTLSLAFVPATLQYVPLQAPPDQTGNQRVIPPTGNQRVPPNTRNQRMPRHDPGSPGGARTPTTTPTTLHTYRPAGRSWFASLTQQSRLHQTPTLRAHPPGSRPYAQRLPTSLVPRTPDHLLRPVTARPTAKPRIPCPQASTRASMTAPSRPRCCNPDIPQAR